MFMLLKYIHRKNWNIRKTITFQFVYNNIMTLLTKELYLCIAIKKYLTLFKYIKKKQLVSHWSIDHVYFDQNKVNS